MVIIALPLADIASLSESSFLGSLFALSAVAELGVGYLVLSGWRDRQPLATAGCLLVTSLVLYVSILLTGGMSGWKWLALIAYSLISIPAAAWAASLSPLDAIDRSDETNVSEAWLMVALLSPLVIPIGFLMLATGGVSDRDREWSLDT